MVSKESQTSNVVYVKDERYYNFTTLFRCVEFNLCYLGLALKKQIDHNRRTTHVLVSTLYDKE